MYPFFFNLLLYIKKMIVAHIHIDFLSYKFQAFVFDYAQLKLYDDLSKQTWAISDPLIISARVIVVPF